MTENQIKCLNDIYCTVRDTQNELTAVMVMVSVILIVSIVDLLTRK